MRDRLISSLDGACLFLRNRANADPAPLNEYDIVAMIEIANICDEAAWILKKAVIPPCKVGQTVYRIVKMSTGVTSKHAVFVCDGKLHGTITPCKPTIKRFIRRVTVTKKQYHRLL